MVQGVEKAYFTVVNKENLGLAEKFSVNPNSCENPSFYREYLQYTALSDLYTGRNTTHLFVDEGENRVMGFVSLRSSTILSEDENGTMTGSPALEIMVLAVDQDYERRGAGTALIDYVLTQADKLHEEFLGIQHLILAADKIAVGFYEKMGFGLMENRWERMPKESWSANCTPMSMFLDFEKNYIESFICDDDDEDDE